MSEGTAVIYNPLTPHPWYQYMQEVAPVFYDGHMWNVFRYQDVQRILLDPSTFSSQFDLGRGMENSMVNSDPPRHRQLRALVTQQFTPRIVAQLEPRITEITHSLLTNVIPDGRMDIVDDLAHPLPTIVIAELLGIPSENRTQFRQWSDALLETNLQSEAEQQMRVAMTTYFQEVIEQRRRSPGSDLISALLTAKIDGERLSEQDILGFCILLLVAGNETTTTLIGNTMLCFDAYPEALEAVQANPSLLPTTLEEVLRYYSPIKILARVATKDTEIGGMHITAGQPVMPWLAAANCDEREFPEANRFNFRRTSNRHIAFGHGIHFCLGAPLARLEAKIAFTVLLERMSEIKRIPDIPLEPIVDAGTQGIKHFHITFRSNNA